VIEPWTFERRDAFQAKRWKPHRRTHPWFTRDDVADGTPCAMCGVDGRTFTDHCHLTGLARGQLCPSCNTREASGFGPAWDAWRVSAPFLTAGQRWHYGPPAIGWQRFNSIRDWQWKSMTELLAICMVYESRTIDLPPAEICPNCGCIQTGEPTDCRQCHHDACEGCIGADGLCDPCHDIERERGF
jgi:hypothetical protein